jgi:hypothetical protein
MLLEPGLGTLAGERDHLASDEPNASLPSPTRTPDQDAGPVALADTFSRYPLFSDFP